MSYSKHAVPVTWRTQNILNKMSMYSARCNKKISVNHMSRRYTS